MSTDTLVHVGFRQRSRRDFVPTVVGDADSAGDSLCQFRGGGQSEEERSRERKEARTEVGEARSWSGCAL